MKSKKEKQLTAQEIYLKKHKQHKLTVSCSRFFVFAVFLIIWEAASDFGMIDSFFFSSPSRVILCAYHMLVDGSLFVKQIISIMVILRMHLME